MASKDGNGSESPAALLLRHAEAMRLGNYALAHEVLGKLVTTGDSTAAGFQLLSLEELCAPLEPVNYLIETLDICPGRPTQINGTGFAGKTIAMQSMVTSIIVGRPVWGTFACRRGRCAHLDYEMGRRATLNRYRRLAVGMGVSWEREVAPHLRLAALPKLYLNTAGIIEGLRRVAEGMTTVVVDSLRRALPGTNENDSTLTEYIDVMTRVSEETGATFVFLHHATTKRNGDEPGDPRGAGRGSSAIFDASSAVLTLAGSKGAPVRVTQTKAAERGTAADDFYLSICDVEVDGNTRAGVCVTHQTVEQFNANRAGQSGPQKEVDRVVEAIQRAGPHGIAGADGVAVAAGMQAKRAREAVRRAVELGLVENVATLKDGSPDDRHPRYVARRSFRPLKGTGRAPDDSSHGRRDERDERDERRPDHIRSRETTVGAGENVVSPQAVGNNGVPLAGGRLDDRGEPDYASKSAPAPLKRPGAWSEPATRSEHEND